MEVIETPLPGILLIRTAVFSDERGFFTESYNRRVFAEHGLNYDFVQDNHSLSVRAGVLRGLHYQLNPKAQSKLIRVLSGSVYDVVVDLRRSSPTFGQWYGTTLSAENKLQLLVPRGFAHGFCTLEPNTQVFYKTDEHYSPEHERGIVWNDPELAIPWPVKNPILSEKDRRWPAFAEAEHNFD